MGDRRVVLMRRGMQLGPDRVLHSRAPIFARALAWQWLPQPAKDYSRIHPAAGVNAIAAPRAVDSARGVEAPNYVRETRRSGLEVREGDARCG